MPRLPTHLVQELNAVTVDHSAIREATNTCTFALYIIPPADPKSMITFSQALAGIRTQLGSVERQLEVSGNALDRSALGEAPNTIVLCIILLYIMEYLYIR